MVVQYKIFFPNDSAFHVHIDCCFVSLIKQALIKLFLLIFTVTYGNNCYVLDLEESPKAWVALPDMPGKLNA